jgi:hypothetical protein
MTARTQHILFGIGVILFIIIVAAELSGATCRC